MQKIFILIVLFMTLLSLCQVVVGGGSPTTRTMVRSMDQLIAKLGRDISTKNSECAILFNDVCPIGCNGRIGDEALLLDRCGVCGGDGSSCSSGDDDDGKCDSTCIALLVGIPMALLLLVCLVGSIVFFSGAAARRRRQEEAAQQRRNTTPTSSQTTTNKHFSPPLRSHGNPVQIRGHVNQAPTYGRKHSTVAMITKKKPKTKIRWTNGAPYGWGKGDKYY